MIPESEENDFLERLDVREGRDGEFDNMAVPDLFRTDRGPALVEFVEEIPCGRDPFTDAFVVDNWLEFVEEIDLRAEFFGEFRFEILLRGRVVRVNAIAILLAFYHNGVGCGREREAHRPGHRRDVHPDFGTFVEFGVDKIKGLFKRGVIIIDISDNESFR